MKKIFLIVACVLLTVLLFSCNQQHVHSFEGNVEKAATCGEAGTLKKICTSCGIVEIEEIPATGSHSFGGWQLASSASMCRICALCGFCESAPIPNENNSNGNSGNVNSQTGNNSNGNSETPNPDSGNSGSHHYSSFQDFAADCQGNGNTVTYSNHYSDISLSLTGGSCNNKTIVIPKNVTSVEFVGLTSGSPFSNVNIKIEERVTDINVVFTDVRIESNNTILTSESRSINFNITMRGEACSFINTGTGAKGNDGIDGATNDTDLVYGKAGANGTPAFRVNGNVTINVDAKTLTIKGGNGGDGGAGGHIVTSSAPSGGAGGKGGDAIDGDQTATVIVGASSTVSIKGGNGGVGGEGGISEVGYFGKNRKGSNGANGANGISGCEIIQN